jgi:hypothetical protein
MEISGMQDSYHGRSDSLLNGMSERLKRNLMASQKLTNCCVAAMALVTAAYLSTPHSSTLRALHLALFA